MKKIKILIADRISQEAVLLLQQHDFIEVKKAESIRHFEPTEIASANGLIIRSRTKIDEELLSKARNLQLIVSATSGFDHIDLEATTKWGITVMHTPSASTESSAQHTFALILACANKIIQSHKAVKAGEWQIDQTVKDTLSTMELRGRTLGIVGLGRIGSRVAQIAQVFGMNVVAYDYYQDEQIFQVLNVPRVSFEELLKCSDVISFHVPKTLETDNMLNRSHFEYIHRGVIIINTSRGSVIHEQDLCDALNDGFVGAAGLDVFEKEPLARNARLLSFSNVVLTPHLGANSEDAFYKASSLAAQKVITFFLDGSTSDTLPPKAIWYGATPPFKD